ncbi:MAG TPA: PAS domain S-box protein [Rhodospirillaceae bacterium]|nr:PAS domain S-box protein [Rhodospirillaceae bacterium]
MKFRPSLLAVLAAAILLVSAVCVFLYKDDTLKAQERLLTQAMARNDMRAKQLAGSVGQLTVATIRLFDIALFQIRDAFDHDRAHFSATVDLILKHLPSGAVNLVLVVDAGGQVIYSSDGISQGVNVADRPHFRAFADSDRDDLYIGQPVRGRLGEKKWVIPLSRGIRKNGNFEGVVVIGLLPDYLSETFAALSLDPGDVVALVQNDGTFLARNHSLDQALGRKAPADRPFLDPARSDDETYRSVSSVDNIPVDFAWKRLPEWGLISVVALDERAELGLIRSAVDTSGLRTDITIAVILAFSLMISGLLLWAQRQQAQLVNTGGLLRSIMDSLPNSIAVLDETGEIIQVNQSWSEFARENDAAPSVVRGTGLNYFTVCRGDGTDLLALEAVAGMLAVLDGRLPRFVQEYPCHSPSQSHWFEFRVTPLVGTQRGLVTSHIEITERKLAQQRMEQLLVEQKTMLDNDLIGIVMVKNRSIVWANQAYEKMHGYAPGEFNGVSTRQAYPTEDAYLSFAAEAYPVLDAGGVYRTQVEHICKDGRHIWVDVSGATLDRHGGTSLWGFIDISERKALEFGLRETNAELEQFAYVASHDLRQPLRMVTSYLRLIERGLGAQLDDNLKRYLGFAVDGAKRMDRLILDLLEYSRTGRSVEPGPVALGQAAGDAVLNLTMAIGESAAIVSIPDEMPTITGDPTEMTRLFQNLIGNAIKYRSPDRPPKVEIGWRRQSNKVLVWVKDNGMGIAPDNRERAFQIFQRLVPKDAVEGSGIGLAVCKKIVEHSGGKIWIESDVGEGSTFFMTFPVQSQLVNAAG